MEVPLHKEFDILNSQNFIYMADMSLPESEYTAFIRFPKNFPWKIV